MPKYAPRKIADELGAADNAPTADAKGDLLEQLMTYVFTKIPSVQLEDKNILDGPRAHELDLAFWHLQGESGLNFLDPLFIVECKHSATPVGSAAVAWFVEKLRARNAKVGVLVALNGITGSADGHSAAHQQLLDALTGSGVYILTVDRTELLALRSTNDLIALLRRKYASLFLRRAVA